MSALDTNGEEHRHRCEVWWLLRKRAALTADIGVKRAIKACREYLNDVADRRGEPASRRLEADATKQWLLGNRGASREWVVEGE